MSKEKFYCKRCGKELVNGGCLSQVDHKLICIYCDNKEQPKELVKQIADLEAKLLEKDLRIEELESQFAYECECNKQFVECQKENEMLKQQLTCKEKTINNLLAETQDLKKVLQNVSDKLIAEDKIALEQKGEKQIMPPDIEFVDVVYNLLKNNINDKNIILMDDIIYIPMKDKEVKIEITSHKYKGE